MLTIHRIFKLDNIILFGGCILEIMRFKGMKVLVLCPHTDDGELGAGGTIARIIEEGAHIYFGVFSYADDSLPQGFSKGAIREEYYESMKVLGVNKENIRVYDYRVRTFPAHRQDILEHIIKLRNSIRPDIVITPSVNDHHQDHKTVYDETIRVFKNTATIMCYELPWNNIGFNTNMIVRLEKRHIDRKWECLECYKTQFVKQRDYFSKDFIESLARVRGVQSGALYGEAFEVVRWIA